jgi:ferredoxin
MPTVLVTNFAIAANNPQFDLKDSEVIFDGIQRHGVELPHGCLSGSCGACRIEVINGIENLKPASAVEIDTINHLKNSLSQNSGNDKYKNMNIRLACRAKVIGDITISSIK